MNQINHVIKVLGKDVYKRRAVASVYLPQFDQHESRDEVPCTLNLQYLIRGNQTNAITYMRSQNAYRLLPYDVFLFTMIQEYVNAVLSIHHNVELGKYNHFSGSFHIYEKDMELVEKAITETPTSIPMEPMPHDNVKFKMEQLQEFEISIRNITQSYKQLTGNININFNAFLEQLDELFSEPYWKQMGRVLVCYAAIKVGDESMYKQVLGTLNSSYKHLVKAYVSKENIFI